MNKSFELDKENKKFVKIINIDLRKADIFRAIYDSPAFTSNNAILLDNELLAVNFDYSMEKNKFFLNLKIMNISSHTLQSFQNRIIYPKSNKKTNKKIFFFLDMYVNCEKIDFSKESLINQQFNIGIENFEALYIETELNFM